MGDNPRYILYQSAYTAVSVENPEAPCDRVITLAGKCCESGDLIGENMHTSEFKTGEIVAVLSTGAYNYSMASNYNRIHRPPVIMVSDGMAKAAVRRETLNLCAISLWLTPSRLLCIQTARSSRSCVYS